MSNVCDEDIISRCIIFDRAFLGSEHIDGYLFRFEGSSKVDGASHESAVLRRLAPMDADVHAIGCKIAAVQNARKGEPPRGPKRRYYCGFRSARVKDLQLCGDQYTVVLDNDGEGAEPAHVDVALVVASSDRSEKATIITEAGLALAEVFGAATPHVCYMDVDDTAHPINRDPQCLNRRVQPLQIGLKPW